MKNKHRNLNLSAAALAVFFSFSISNAYAYTIAGTGTFSAISDSAVDQPNETPPSNRPDGRNVEYCAMCYCINSQTSGFYNSAWVLLDVVSFNPDGSVGMNMSAGCREIQAAYGHPWVCKLDLDTVRECQPVISP